MSDFMLEEGINIPNSVSAIGNNAFAGCRSIEKVNFRNASAGSESFKDCVSLKSVTIGENETSIDNGQFYNCKSLSYVSFPSTVNSIGASAFGLCGGLTVFDFTTATAIPELDDANAFDSDVANYDFFSNKDGKRIVVPKDMKDEWRATTNWSDATVSGAIVDPDYESDVPSVTATMYKKVGSDEWITRTAASFPATANATSGLDKITTLICGPQLKAFENYYSSSYLLYLVDRSPSGLWYYPSYSGAKFITGAFANSENLEYLYLNNSITGIGKWAFANTRHIKNKIDLPSAATISAEAFRDCAGLKGEVYFPSTLKFYPSGGTCSAFCNTDIEKFLFDDGTYYTGSLNSNTCVLPKLKEIYWPTNISGTDYYIYRAPFGYQYSNCPSVEKITLKDCMTGSDTLSYVYRDASAYGYCALKEIYIGSAYSCWTDLPFYWSDGGSFSADQQIPSAIQDVEFIGVFPSEKIVVSDDNPYYYSISGVMYQRPYNIGEKTNGHVLMLCPSGKSGEYTIDSSCSAVNMGAFANSKDLKVTNVSSLTSIGYKAFYGCGQNLTDDWEITFSPNLTGKNIKHYTEYGPGGPSDIREYYKVESPLGKYEFVNSGVTKATIPYGVSTDFYGTTTTDYGSSVITGGVFGNSKLKTFSISADRVPNYCCENCTALSSVTFGNSVTGIGYGAFRNTAISNVTIPDGVVEICASAFKDCDNLKTVIIGNGLTTLHHNNSSVYPRYQYIFDGSDNIEYIKLGAALSAVSSVSGIHCKQEYDINSANPYFSVSNGLLLCENGTKLFRAPTEMETVNVPVGTLTACSSAFCKSVGSSIYFPNTLTDLEENTFYCCSGISVHVSKSVSAISSKAFTGSTLTDFTIDSDNQYFSCVDGLLMTKSGDEIITSIPLLNEDSQRNIPSTVLKIDDYAFYDNKSITGVNLSNTKEIGNYAFAHCNRLYNVTNTNLLTAIGEYAFADCGNLYLAEVSGKQELKPLTVSPYIPFYDDYEIRGDVGFDMQWPSGVDTLSKGVFAGTLFRIGNNKAQNTLSHILPSSVHKIGDKAFYDFDFAYCGKKHYGSDITHKEYTYTSYNGTVNTWYSDDSDSEFKDTHMVNMLSLFAGHDPTTKDNQEVVYRDAIIPSTVTDVGINDYSFGPFGPIKELKNSVYPTDSDYIDQINKMVFETDGNNFNMITLPNSWGSGVENYIFKFSNLDSGQIKSLNNYPWNIVEENVWFVDKNNECWNIAGGGYYS